MMPNRALLVALAALAAACASPPSSSEPAAPPVASASATTAPGPPAAAPSASVPSPVGAAPVPPPVARGALVLEREIAIGKWPEQVVVAGDVAWVAESGARRVARVPLDGKGAITNVPVGRLPVQLALDAGKLYTLAHTDNAIWEIDTAKQRGRIVATVPDCPESMTVSASTAWVLLWSKCSSADSSVARVDLATGKQIVSAATGKDAWSIAEAGGRAWVALGDGTLASVDSARPADVKVHGAPGAPGAARVVVASPSAIFASQGRTLARFDPTTGARTGEVSVASRIAAIAVQGERVLVADDQGRVSVLDATTLAVRRELSMPAPGVVPRGMALWGDRIVITSHGTPDDRGRLLVLSVPPGPG